MAGNRVRINWPVVHELLKAPGVQAEIKSQTRRIDQNAAAQGAQTKVDFAADGARPRGAVIAGYENDASAERTRRILLRSLEFGGTQ